MSLLSLKEEFAKLRLSKSEFIDRMYDIHSALIQYSEYIKDTEIRSIEIVPGKVIMTAKPIEGKNMIRMECVLKDKRTTTLEILNFGSYEQEDSSMLFALCDTKDVVFDIGANLGWYSLNFAHKLIGGKVYSFEPIPETYKLLQSNLELNPRCSNIVTNNLALSNTSGQTIFYYSPGELGAASAKNIKENAAVKKIKCQTLTLDDFVKKQRIKALDLIKCDVEGSELYVFQGATESLKKFTPVIFTEMLRKWAAKFNYHPNEIISLLKDIGYECYCIRNNKLKRIPVITEDTRETNFIFLHSIKHKQKIRKFVN
jgi:FkbM family methyltransferase